MSRAFALIRTLVVGTLFLSIWLYWLPRWFARIEKTDLVPRQPWAWPIFAIGFAISLWCAIEFALRGLGTPAPFDPPRRLVVSGLYRGVRNPMYVGLGIALIGEALLLPQIGREMLMMIALLAVVVGLMVTFVEEPALRRQFGADYDDYCRHVGRWIPGLKPFDKGGTAA